MTTQQKARCTIESTPHGDVLTIAGEIDDTTDLASYGAQLQRNAIIDLGGVTFINSVGVREWVTLLDQVMGRGIRVTLRNVSEPMVRQMTMVMEAKGEANVESFFAPYICTKCGDERALLLELAHHHAALAAGTPPHLPCAKCGAAAEFDEFPARYLAFLT
ncbi:MAG TPA: STAS domain-containing protein [Kofleriaceae bacterium]|nr:STAS domain-containing protein [Kofleriaceae bacterium]